MVSCTRVGKRRAIVVGSVIAVAFSLTGAAVAPESAYAGASTPCLGTSAKDVNAVLPKPLKLHIITSDPTICDIQHGAEGTGFAVHVVFFPGAAASGYATIQSQDAKNGTTAPITDLPKGWEGYVATPTLDPGSPSAHARSTTNPSLRTIEIDVINPPTDGPVLTSSAAASVASKLTRRAIARVTAATKK